MHGRFRALGISLAVALAVLALAELGLRACDAPVAGAAASAPPWMDGDTYDLWQRWTRRQGVPLSDVTDLQGWRWDPELRWALKPDLSMKARNIFLDPLLGDAAHWRLTTNALGFRTPPYQASKQQDTLRVVVLGDSNSMGWLLADEATYPARLQHHLVERLGRTVEVVNLGVGGYTSFSTLALWRREASQLSPDALVISCGANDPQQMTLSDQNYAFEHTGSMGKARRRLGRLRLAGWLRATFSDPPGAPARSPRVTAKEYGDNLDALLTEVRGRDIPAAFLRVCCCLEQYETQLGKVTARHGTPVLDATTVAEAALADPAIRERHAAALAEIARWYSEAERRTDSSLQYRFRDRCHLNPLGADLVAAALARSLASQLGQDLPRHGPAD